MSFVPGDRVRWQTTGDDGLPLVRYGFVGSGTHNGEVRVMLDGELKGNRVLPADDLAHVQITNVELRLTGIDLVADRTLCHGLVHLWTAEADEAGLDLGPITLLEVDPSELLTGPVSLAHLSAAGQAYVIQAHPMRSAAIHVRATPLGN